jgi:hemolysin activation/secretion protein
LYRFGGTKSIRGFAENSLQANFIMALKSEYNYIISNDLYIYSILDYAYYEDKTSNIKENIGGIGIGIRLRTKNGNLKFSLSNGINKKQNINFQNSIISVNYDIEF